VSKPPLIRSRLETANKRYGVGGGRSLLFHREDLDEISTEHPILLMHISSHLMTCNSKAVEVADINGQTPGSRRGAFQRKVDGREPNGVLEETAMFAVLQSVPTPTEHDAAEMLKQDLEQYAAEGITRAQDGASFPGTIKLLRALHEAGKLPIDVVADPLHKASDEALVDEVARTWRTWDVFAWAESSSSPTVRSKATRPSSPLRNTKWPLMPRSRKTGVRTMLGCG
jgi:predicted amidohydrolase YtcJ